MSILPYTPKDYLGDLNLLCSEKDLIRKAYIKTNGELEEMMKLLRMRKFDLLVAVIRHFNVTSFSSEKSPTEREKASKP